MSSSTNQTDSVLNESSEVSADMNKLSLNGSTQSKTNGNSKPILTSLSSTTTTNGQSNGNGNGYSNGSSTNGHINNGHSITDDEIECELEQEASSIIQVQQKESSLSKTSNCVQNGTHSQNGRSNKVKTN